MECTCSADGGNGALEELGAQRNVHLAGAASSTSSANAATGCSRAAMLADAANEL
jgi:hypothetical protein